MSTQDEAVKIDERGRLTVPKELREEHGIPEGRIYAPRVQDDGTVVFRPLQPVGDG